MTAQTKTWVVSLKLQIEDGSHPRKFIPDAINQCLNFDVGEDLTDYDFVCIDED